MESKIKRLAVKKTGKPRSLKEAKAHWDKYDRKRKDIADEFKAIVNMPKSDNWTGWKKRVLIAVPTTGQVRIEWMMSRNGQVIPCNWSNGDILQFFNQYSPVGWAVAEARNVCVEHFIKEGYEWLFFLDHDVCLPPDTFLRLNEYMMEGKYPVISGLYFCKGTHPEPLLFRGRGNGFFNNFRRGERVWVDGIPMGLTLIHRDIMVRLWETSPEVVLPSTGGNKVVRKVFETPRNAWFDPETNQYGQRVGTEDLFWCDRVINEKVFEKCGNKKWARFGKMKFPFLCDTELFGRHIDENGRIYP